MKHINLEIIQATYNQLFEDNRNIANYAPSDYIEYMAYQKVCKEVKLIIKKTFDKLYATGNITRWYQAMPDCLERIQMKKRDLRFKSSKCSEEEFKSLCYEIQSIDRIYNGLARLVAG